jgi:GNAT superfamily N-acetyltransferase
MPDMLVRLYDLPPLEPELASMAAQSIEVRPAMAHEKHIVVEWIARHFSPGWASEADVAMSHVPIGCWLAVEHDRIIGFACRNASAKGFFGPTGVTETARGRGVGRALLIACLHALRADGYAYGIIGAVGPIDFYAGAVGATVIEHSTPGIYGAQLESG